MAVHYLGDNGPDGMCVGTATTEKVAFHGSTPVVQQTVTTLDSAATIATVRASVIELIAALRAYGLGSS